MNVSFNRLLVPSIHSSRYSSHHGWLSWRVWCCLFSQKCPQLLLNNTGRKEKKKILSPPTFRYQAFQFHSSFPHKKVFRNFFFRIRYISKCLIVCSAYLILLMLLFRYNMIGSSFLLLRQKWRNSPLSSLVWHSRTLSANAHNQKGVRSNKNRKNKEVEGEMCVRKRGRRVLSSWWPKQSSLSLSLHLFLTNEVRRRLVKTLSSEKRSFFFFFHFWMCLQRPSLFFFFATPLKTKVALPQTEEESPGLAMLWGGRETQSRVCKLFFLFFFSYSSPTLSYFLSQKLVLFYCYCVFRTLNVCSNISSNNNNKPRKEFLFYLFSHARKIFFSKKSTFLRYVLCA